MGEGVKKGEKRMNILNQELSTDFLHSLVFWGEKEVEREKKEEQQDPSRW